LDFLPASNTRNVAEGGEHDKPSAESSDFNFDSLPESSPTLPKNPVVDMGVPSTSRSTDFQKTIAKVSPVSDDLQRKIVNRKRRGEKSAILTSTPFINMLEQKEEIKRQKKQIALCGKK
ncbi:hypothetical protein ANN_27400, partial [Periplaneta americana]